MANQASSTPVPRARPTAPDFLFKLFNPLMAALLRSPLHPLLSSRLMLLTFTGRKSRKIYTTPVGYLLQNDQVIVMNRSGWWRNFRFSAPVTVRIKNQTWQGTARLVDNPAEIKTIIHNLYAARGPEMARRLGYAVDSLDASPDVIAGQVKDTHFIAIRLEAK